MKTIYSELNMNKQRLDKLSGINSFVPIWFNYTIFMDCNTMRDFYESIEKKYKLKIVVDDFIKVKMNPQDFDILRSIIKTNRVRNFKGTEQQSNIADADCLSQMPVLDENIESGKLEVY